MFIRSNGKIRLTNEAYASWFGLVTVWYPGIALVCLVLSLIWEKGYWTLIASISVGASLLAGVAIRISDKRRKEDTAAYDGLVSVVPATEDRVKQVIFRLYQGPEALDEQSKILLKVDHGAISIEEFDENEPDEDEEPRK